MGERHKRSNDEDDLIDSGRVNFDYETVIVDTWIIVVQLEYSVQSGPFSLLIVTVWTE